MDWCTGRRDITELILKTTLKTLQLIDQSINQNYRKCYGSISAWF